MATSSTRQLYFDYNATTPLGDEAVAAITASLHVFGNPSSDHSFGQAAKAEVDAARAHTAALIGAAPGEIIYTGSGSESANLAVKGVAAGWSAPMHVITSAIEHSAVLEACRHLASLGHQVTCVGVDRAGRVDPDAVARNIRPNTGLISIMHANNETGVIQPIEEIGAIARQAGVLFHTDASQSVGKIRVDVSLLPVDLLTFSAHKIYGPKGVGMLFVREDVELQPLVQGGGQESGLRAGTENVLGIIGAGAACEAARLALAHEPERLAKLRNRLLWGILDIGDVHVNGDLRHVAPGTLNVSFGRIKGDALAAALAFQGVAVSTGSACHAGGGEPSHVLRAMRIGNNWLRGAVRFSMGRGTAEADVDHLLDVLSRSVAGLRRMSPLARPERTDRRSAQHSPIGATAP